MKYTASYLTLSHLFHTIGRLSETAKKRFPHLKFTDSSSFNHKSFSFQKCSKENPQSNLFVLFYELSQFRYFARVCLECLWIESVNPPL